MAGGTLKGNRYIELLGLSKGWLQQGVSHTD